MLESIHAEGSYLKDWVPLLFSDSAVRVKSCLCGAASLSTCSLFTCGGRNRKPATPTDCYDTDPSAALLALPVRPEHRSSRWHDSSKLLHLLPTPPITPLRKSRHELFMKIYANRDKENPNSPQRGQVGNFFCEWTISINRTRISMFKIFLIVQMASFCFTSTWNCQ